MEAILDLVFQLYRAAQDTRLADFQDLALTLVEGLVPFCGAIWFAAKLNLGGVHFLRIHPHRLAPEVVGMFASTNRRSSHALRIAARMPRRAHRFDASDLYIEPHDREITDVARQDRRERVLLIADLATPVSAGEWLALFRRKEAEPFVDRELQAITLLMPHLSQALALTRALNDEPRATPRADCSEREMERSQADAGRSWAEADRSQARMGAPAGDRALVRADGTVLHCGARLAELIRAESSEWDGARLPAVILREALRGGIVHLASKARSVEVSPLGEALLLTVRDMPLADRLSPQELHVAHLFGAGASYKEIARRITLSPATVRNVVQNAYRKLGINNKAQLARLMVGPG